MSTTRAHRTKLIEIDSEAGVRPTMPEPTFLQIQGGGEPSTRTIELPPSPVRIGRGSHCEVRLNDPRLGDVQCMLRRRGAVWHFLPVGPAGQVWFDGRAADQQRPVPLGVPFRVGEHWLTLRPADSAFNDWGSFDAPISIEPETAEVPRTIVSRPDEPVLDKDRPRAQPTADDNNEERLRRWEARLEQRERWLKDRQEERRWEARWKSAGESIRTRTTPSAAKPPEPNRTLSPTPPPVRPSRISTRPGPTPPVARIIEPRPSEPVRRSADPTPRPPTPRGVDRPNPGPPIPAPRPARMEVAPRREVPPVALSVPVAPPQSRALVTLPPPFRPSEDFERRETQSLASEVVEERALVETVSENAAAAEPGALDEIAAASEGCLSGLKPALAGDLGSDSTNLLEAETPLLVSLGQDPAHEADPLALIEADPFDRKIRTDDLGLAETPLFDMPNEDSAGPSASTDVVAEISPALSSEIAFRVDRPESLEPKVTPPHRTEGLATEDLRDPELSKVAWPSARSIFEAQGRRVGPETDGPRASLKRKNEPMPTESIGPACWSMPGWLGALPVLIATILIGFGGIGLAYDWAIEANNANLAIRLASRPDGVPGSAIEADLIPRGGWWTSTAPHLSAWALALVRQADGEDRSESIRSLLDASREASQLGSRSRFLVELPRAIEPGAPGDLANLGRTRDVVTLAWSARRLRKEGKLDSAIRAYRSAMEIASHAGLEHLDPPIFFEDPQVRRYALPHEGLIGYVAKAMVEEGEWTHEQWTQALPASSTASLVTARVLARMQRPGDADRLADLAIRQAEAGPLDGPDAAEDRAAGAEALAYRGRWTDAAEQYRLAIDQSDDDPTRRMWWLNLAEVAQRTGDDAARGRAIEAAKMPDSVDAITRRALEYQKSFSMPTAPSPRR